jgi:hypothetical protein
VTVVWRLVFGALRSRPVVGLLAAVLRAVDLVAGRARRDAVVRLFDALVVRSGWPGHARGWINLYASELRVRALRGPGIRAHRREARPATAAPRIGFFGPFAGLLSFPRELFAACPPEVELVLFDVPFRGARGEYLAPLCREYVPLPEPLEGDGRWVAEVAARVDAAGLDLFVNVGQRPESYDLIDLLSVPCVAHHCDGSDLFHHAGVDFQMHGQPQPDFFVQDDVMFCGLTRRPFSHRPVFPISGYYDRRGLDPRAARPRWSERDPLIVSHGALHKLGDPGFLGCLFELLTADASLEFVMTGKDPLRTLTAIMGAARRRGLAARVHYEGEFSAVREADGSVPASGWERLFSLLSRARLAPDPWPIGGGSARFEAYLAGAPSAHMGVRLDGEAWGRRQVAACDIPSLSVERATAFDVAAYREIARRCLYEGDFADAVAAEQREVAVRLSDDRAWWTRLLGHYARWRSAGTAH